MMNIWEQNIKEWYEKTGTSRLSYLDLANTEKPSTKELAHNIAVIYDRVCLSSKVNLKEFHCHQHQANSLENSIHQLTRKIEKLEKGIIALTQFYLENKPLTREEVRILVNEIAQQPKIAEEQAFKLTRNLQEKLDQVEALLYQIKGSLIG